MRRARLVLALAFVAFVSLGLPDWMMGVAWPDLRREMSVPQAAMGLLLFASGAGYLASSLMAGTLARRLGLGLLLAASCVAYAIACGGFAVAPAFPWLVGLCLLAGLGGGAIDTGLNAHVSTHFSARAVAWLHASYSLGATLGPLAMTAALVHVGSWRPGYGGVGAVMLALALLFLATGRAWGAPAPASGAGTPGRLATSAHPLVRQQVLVFFLYTGIECCAGAWCFTVLSEGRGLETGPAGLATTTFFAAIGLGRVAFGLIADRVDLDRLLRASTAVALGGALLFALPQPRGLDVVGLTLLGLVLAPIFPALMSRTPKRLGPELAAHAFGFQTVAAMLGAVTLPSAAGFLAGRIGPFAVPWLVVGLVALLIAAHERLVRRSARAER